jgi:hypothetical protein
VTTPGKPELNRDRILTEKIVRGCWHGYPDKGSSLWQFSSSNCKKCGAFFGHAIHINFSTWNGFGELWDQLKQRKYWSDFWKWLTQKYSWEEWESKALDQRADVVFQFWQELGEMADKGQA